MAPLASGKNVLPNLEVTNIASGWVMASKLININNSSLVSSPVALTLRRYKRLTISIIA